MTDGVDIAVDDPDLEALARPDADGAVVDRIARSRPELRPVAAMHPQVDAATLTWLAGCGDRAVDAVLAARAEQAAAAPRAAQRRHRGEDTAPFTCVSCRGLIPGDSMVCPRCGRDPREHAETARPFRWRRSQRRELNPLAVAGMVVAGTSIALAGVGLLIGR